LKNLVILASGKGSNAERICEYFKEHDSVRVALIITNNPHAGVLDVAKRHSVSSKVLTNEEVREGSLLIRICTEFEADLIVLAGFLRKIPESIIAHYPSKIINIHPALLPKYGGKGMYGMHVHRAVKENNEVYSGITIHFVNEHYDEGAIIRQVRCALEQDDSPEDIATRVHRLEHANYAETIEQLLSE